MAEPPIEGLKALAHPLRYVILASLTGTERNVGEIEAATGIGQPALSQQLSVLRNAGLVSARRDAKLVYYSAEADVIRDLAQAVAKLLPGGTEASPAAVRDSSRRITGAAVFAKLD